MDFNFLLSRMCLVDSTEGKKHNIILSDSQKDKSRSILSNCANIIYAGKGEGTSTLMALHAIFEAVSKGRQNIMFITEFVHDPITELIELNRNVFDGINLPTLVTRSKQEYKFSNGSTIFVKLYRPGVSRGYSLNSVFFDNFDMQRQAEEFISLQICLMNAGGPGTMLLTTDKYCNKSIWKEQWNEIFGDCYWGSRRVLIEALF